MNLGGLIRVPAEVYNEYIEFNLRKFQAKYAATDSNFNSKSNSNSTTTTTTTTTNNNSTANKKHNNNSNSSHNNNSSSSGSGVEVMLDSGGEVTVTSTLEGEDTLVNKEDI